MSFFSDYLTRRELAPRVRVKGLRTRRVYMRFPRALDGAVGVGTLKGFEGQRFIVVPQDIPEKGDAKATVHYAVTCKHFDDRLAGGTVAVFPAAADAQEALNALGKAMAPSRWRYVGYAIVFMVLWGFLTKPMISAEVAMPAPAQYLQPYGGPTGSLPPGVTLGAGAAPPVMPTRPPQMAAPAPAAPAADPFGLNLGGAAK